VIKKNNEREEIIIDYSLEQRKLFLKNDAKCIYPTFPRIGIHRTGGNFPAMVVRKHYEDLGYSVVDRYFLIRCSRKRENNDGFKKLCKIFGEEKVNKTLADAKSKKLKGGDPDLFVYKEDFSESFFVEVKENDELIQNQLILIPIIEKHLCPVYVARVRPKP
jgi:hypothetical protein